jgi:hypothetical protein
MKNAHLGCAKAEVCCNSVCVCLGIDAPLGERFSSGKARFKGVFEDLRPRLTDKSAEGGESRELSIGE